MIFLRQSTASQEVILGPFLDDTDGKTAETGLTIANTDIKIWKTGGTTESDKNSGGATHIASGRYYAVLDATDTNTIGPLEVNVHVSGALPVKVRCCVLDEAVYDVMFGTTSPSTYAGGDTSGVTTLLSRIGSSLTITSGRVNADVTHIATAAVNTNSAQLGVNVVNFGGSAGTFVSGRPAVNASYIGGVPVTATTSITFPAASTVATTTGAVGSVTGAVGSVTGAVGSVTGNVGGNVTGSVGSIATGGIAATSFAAGAINAAAIANGAIDAATFAADVDAEILSYLVDDATRIDVSALNTATGTTIPAILVDTAEIGAAGAGLTVLATAANLATVAGYLDTEIAAILEDTGTTIPAQIAALNNLSAAQVNAEVDTALADINLDHLVKSAVDTDFATTVHLNSVIGQLADNGTSATFDRTTDSLEAIRDRGDAAWITATGFSTLDAAGVRAAVGLASANLDAQLDALPTATENATAVRSELATELGRIDVATSTRLASASYTTPLDAAGTRSAIGLASANLDTQIGTLATAANLATVAGYLDTEIAAILADTNELQADWANGGRLDLLVDAIKAKTDNLPSDPADQSAVEAAITAATSPLATQASVNTIDDFLDTEIAAIKAKTDSLTFTVAGQVDANVQYVNDTQVGGTGASGDEWGPV